MGVKEQVPSVTLQDCMMVQHTVQGVLSTAGFLWINKGSNNENQNRNVAEVAHALCGEVSFSVTKQL